MRYELATPLLFANLLRWISPEIFRRWEISGGSVGAVKLEMDQNTAREDVKVTAEDGSPLPFTLRDKTVNFFAGAPGAVRVVAGDREYMYSLTLPELSDTKWKPPATALEGHSVLRSGSGSRCGLVAMVGIGGRIVSVG